MAARWVADHAAELPSFAGALLAGSATWLPGDAELPGTSDLDVMIVTTDHHAPPKLGKLASAGVLLDVTYLSWDQLGSSADVLASYHLAGIFRAGTIIADPTGRLAPLQAATAAGFARRPWVRRRCQDAERRIVERLGRVDAPGSRHDQVTTWLFATGVTTHVLLAAGLRNPTVRLRYLAARSLLLEHGRPEVHEELLELLGCARLTRGRVEAHLRAMTTTFDAAAVAAGTRPFASDITSTARPIAVDGSRDLIAQGHHREAVFWIAVTYARCVTILADADRAPGTARRDPGFTALLDDLDVTSAADRRRRAQEVRDYLPRLRAVKEAILAATPGIED